MTVRETLDARLSSLSQQERRVARALLADYPRAALGTSATLASAAGVSAPTVVRFARSLGYAGFSALQQSLVDELSDRVASPLSQYDSTRQVRADSHWLERGVEIATEEIGRSLKAIPKAELDGALQLLADTRKRITAVGGRYSGHLAGYLTLHLQQMRPRVRAPEHAHTIGVPELMDSDRNDAFVIYDFRRYQTDTVQGALRLSEAGVQIICITDEWLSPVAQVADIVLPTSVQSSGAFDSAAAAFVLTELLIEALLDKLGTAAVARMRLWERATTHQVQSHLAETLPGEPVHLPSE